MAGELLDVAAVAALALVGPPPTATIDVVEQYGDGPGSVSFDGIGAAMAKASLF